MDRQVEVKATGFDLNDVRRQILEAPRRTWLTINVSTPDPSIDLPCRFSETFWIELNDLDGSTMKKELRSGRELLAFITPLVERQIKGAAEFQLKTEQQRREYLDAEMEAINKVIADAMDKRDILRKEVSKLGKGKAKGKA